MFALVKAEWKSPSGNSLLRVHLSSPECGWRRVGLTSVVHIGFRTREFSFDVLLLQTVLRLLHKPHRCPLALQTVCRSRSNPRHAAVSAKGLVFSKWPPADPASSC